jgi:phosphoribosylaminoimidazole-succinocarboxamide synthase
MIVHMKKRTKLYEGKAKILYESGQPGLIIQHFKDDTTAFNRQKQAIIEGKGVLNNLISEFIMHKLGNIGVPTHFIKRLNMREQLVRQTEIIPVEVVVRNIAAGSLVKRLGIVEKTVLSRPIIEFYYKNDALGDPIVSDEHILAFEWANPYELSAMVTLAMRINDFLCGLFAGVGLTLVDFKTEYGRLMDENGDIQIMLSDEISPDSCRLWDATSGEILDKDRFRNDMGGVKEAYQEVARRLGVLPKGGIENLVRLSIDDALPVVDDVPPIKGVKKSVKKSPKPKNPVA